jgi:hypothetical protein
LDLTLKGKVYHSQKNRSLTPGAGPRGTITGSFEGSVEGAFVLKECYLLYRKIVDSPLSLTVAGNFTVGGDNDYPGGGFDGCCIDSDLITVIYSSFTLESAFLNNPAFLVVKTKVEDHIKEAIRAALAQYAYDTAFRCEGQTRRNVYCGTNQASTGGPSCECID